MRRADRLFLVIHCLRSRRTALPARRLAETLGVSVRTVYRDVADLQRSGIPIEGEAGVGYVLRKGSDVPPLMFDAHELEALVVGARFTQTYAAGRLAEGARTAILKIDAVLTPELRAHAKRTRVYAPVRDEQVRVALSGRLDQLNAAIASRHVAHLKYVDETGSATERDIEPLCLAFWGNAWTLGAWCRLRSDFRNFRLDRVRGCTIGGESFRDDPQRNLVAYFVHIGQTPPQ
ncbi:MAG TPA: YafY family protein [Rhodanobacteraceae bacterium]